MAFSQVTFKSVALMAAALLLASPVQALPVESVSRRGTDSKRILLWPYQNTADIESGNTALTSTAKTLADSGSYMYAANWETWRPEELPTSLSFAPTVATREHLDDAHWQQLESAIQGQTSPVVQFYNEPDINGIDATQAAQDWMDKMVPLRANNGAKLVGPSCTSDPDSASWLSTFMGALDDASKPDYLGVHFYTTDGNPVDGEISYAKNFLEETHSTYGIPLVVNEISSTSRTQSDVTTFSETMADYMDNLDWVHAYGFTGVSLQVADSYSSPEAQQLNSDGSMTALGRYMASSQ
ncbi:glycosyl hydrolase catalytic core-domain-containing protein [Xylariaceae sp. FL0016]|nr:glycosyl hydrolase catalytic core-domain-containing protein [Xylariaceae sp. FL0016]